MSAVAIAAAKLVASLFAVPEEERSVALAIIRGAFPEEPAGPLSPAERARRYRHGKRHGERDESSRDCVTECDENSDGERDENGLSRDVVSRLGGKGGSRSESSSSDLPPSEQNETYQVSTAARLNPAALVEHFVSGVNEAGGVWSCPSGKPFGDLARALQPHAVRAVPRSPGEEGGPTWRCLDLGRRWFAFCEGMPDDAWKAAAWLGKGAPASREAKPESPGAAKARRGEEAKARERDEAERRRRETAVPIPAELVAAIGIGGGR